MTLPFARYKLDIMETKTTEIKFKRGEYAEYEIKNGILFTTLIQEIIIDMAAAEVIVRERLELCDGKNYPSLFEFDKFKHADKKVRNYMNTEGLKGIKAGAILTTSLMVKTFMNFYLDISKPDIPAKVFSDREKAITWLMQYID